MPGKRIGSGASVLSIGGLDPGGGAGLLADARAIGATGAYACAVAAVLTVQSTDGLVGSRVVPASWVIAQADEVVRAQRIGVIKVGALGSAANVRALAAWLKENPSLPVVLDPVIRPTLGRARLLASRAVAEMRAQLLPRTTLVTANAPEAAALTLARVDTIEGARRAARELVRLGARAALVKGGHLTGAAVVDVLAVGTRIVEIRSTRLALAPIHGGGCMLASLIAGRLARSEGPLTDAALVAAVRWARRLHQRALRQPKDVGGRMRVLVL